MKQNYHCLTCVYIVLCFITGMVQAADKSTTQLDTITVTDQASTGASAYIATDHDDPAKVYKVGQEGISLFGS
jgi:hypothetical protein